MKINCGGNMEFKPTRRRFAPLSNRCFICAGILGCILVLLATPVFAQNNPCIPSAAQNCGVLKVCKVAGFGVPVNTPFKFNASILSTPVTIPAGPAPGGYCKVSQSINVGTIVNIAETNFSSYGDAVSNIDVVPVANISVPPNLSNGTVSVKIGPGVTEVTYLDHSLNGGYLEICKLGLTTTAPITGNFTFTVNPGSIGPIVVPVGLCSPPIEVPAGILTITETPPAPGIHIASCTAFPVSNGPCQIVGLLAVHVKVVAGTISKQTIATITNSY